MFSPPANHQYMLQTNKMYAPTTQPHSWQPNRKKKANGFGIAGFVIALLAFVIAAATFDNFATALSMCILLVFTVFAFVISVKGTALAKNRNMGVGLAIAGIVLSSHGLVTIISYLVSPHSPLYLQ